MALVLLCAALASWAVGSQAAAPMRDEASAAGRDPAGLEVSLGHSVTKIDDERASRLTAQGADRLVLAMPSITDIEQAKDVLSACAQRLSLST